MRSVSYTHLDVYKRQGLRTGDIYSPFPEEMNRKLTGSIATYHFAPTSSSESNLKKENINIEHLYVTGNTVIDALDTTVQDNYVFDDAAINALDPKKRTVLVTTHRRENLGEPMRHVYQAIRDLINEFEDIQVVFPVHKNPKVRQVVQEELGSVDRVTLIDPLDYEPFANLMAKSYLILTDSGGIQEEAPALGKPVLVLRDTTERPEAVEAGTVRLVGTDKDAVHKAAYELLSNAEAVSYTHLDVYKRQILKMIQNGIDCFCGGIRFTTEATISNRCRNRYLWLY